MGTYTGSTRATLDRSRSCGFLERGGKLASGAIPVQLPAELSGAETSVCGIKAFLVDERRAFTAKDGSIQEIDCAKLAALDIVDSPVHVHGETLETYHILSGEGRMILDEQVIAVQAGTVIVIPPGVVHGLCSNDQRPLRVLMTFTPGLAPISQPQWRDEEVLWAAASARLQELANT